MKRLLYVILLFLFITGCSDSSSKILNNSKISSMDYSNMKVDSLCENEENIYYFEEEPFGCELYRQNKNNNEKILLHCEEVISNLTIVKDWLYFTGANNNICKIKNNGEDYSIVMNYKSLKGFDDESVHSLHIIDNFLFIQMGFGFYRYNIQTDKINEIYYDARQVSVLDKDVYFSGRDATIYKINIDDDEPKAILKPEKNSVNKDEWSNLYKNFIFVDGDMYYYKRNPDGLYLYHNNESILINDNSKINEFSLFEYDSKLYYIIYENKSGKLIEYDPEKQKSLQLLTCDNYSSGAKIINGYFYYSDLNLQRYAKKLP